MMFSINGIAYTVEESASGFDWDNTLEEGNDAPTWPTAHQAQQAALDWEAGRRDRMAQERADAEADDRYRKEQQFQGYGL